MNTDSTLTEPTAATGPERVPLAQLAARGAGALSPAYARAVRERGRREPSGRTPAVLFNSSI